MNIQGCIPRFIKGHGSLILTILSGLGLIGTVAVTAKQAPKAKAAIQDSRHDKIDEICDKLFKMDEEELPNGVSSDNLSIFNYARENANLTIMEKIKVAGPYYAPVILLGLGTLGCLAGAQILNTKQQTALIGAYALLQKEFGAYREENREEYGAEADRKALAESRKKIGRLEEEVKRLEAIKDVQTFSIATLPGVIFRSDMANIERAFLHFNRNLILRGWVDMQELYSFLGLPDKGLEIVGRAPDEDYGWNAYINNVNYGCEFLDYRLKPVTDKDGNEAYVIDFDIPPYRIDSIEYDEQTGTDKAGEKYEGYRPEEAARLLKRGVNDIPVLIDSATHDVWAPGLF